MSRLTIRAKSLALRSALRVSLGLHRKMGKKAARATGGRYGQVPSPVRAPEQEITLELSQISMKCCVWDSPGPTLLAVHGLNNNCWSWARLATLLRGKARVIAICQRGHGGSTAPERGYSLGETTRDLLEAMDSLHLPSAHVIGHSWGGKVVTHAAATAPSRFLTATLADPAPPQGLNALIRGLPWIADTALRAERGPFPSEPAWREAGPDIAYLQHWDTADQNLWAASFQSQPDGSFHHVLPETAFQEIMHDTLQEDITPMLDTITCPTMLIRPTLTVSFLPGEFRSMQQRLPRLTLARVQGDHTFIHTNPYDTLEVLLPHLKLSAS